MKFQNRSFLIIVLALAILSQITFAGTTGKLSGLVIDKETGEPLPGVNITITGTTLGGSTDSEGYYSIINIKPGIYEVVYQFIGYRKYVVKDVKVVIDLTTKIEVELETGTVEMNEIVVVAEKPPVQKDRTYTSAVVNSKEITALPVTEVGEVVALQPGVVSSGGKMHFRGGRSREVAYIVDGIPVTNAFDQDGGSNVTVENSMVEQLEVITGTFNAEYGSAQSGIVNIVTKDIANKFSSSFQVYAGDYLTSQSDIFKDQNSYNPLSEKDFQFSVTGPIISDKLGFSVTGRYGTDESLLHYERRYNSIDGWRIAAYTHWFEEQRSDELGNAQAITIPDSLKTGDGSMGPLAKYENTTLNAKLSFLPVPELKLSYQFYGHWHFRDGKTDFRYDPSRLYQPDNQTKYKSEDYSHFITLQHTPSNKLFYNLGFSYQRNHGDEYYRKDNKIAQYPGDDGIQLIDFKSDDFSLGTTAGFYDNADGKDVRELFLLNGSVSWNVDRHNFIKAGFEYKKHKINKYEWGYVATQEWDNTKWLNFAPDPTLTFDQYWQIMSEYWKNWEDIYGTTKYRKYREDEYVNWRDYNIEPSEAAVYLQDKIELGELIVNAGLRFDMFIPNEQVPVNYKVESANLGSEQNLKDATNKYQLSPRLGLSFPISTTGVFHAAYGHFFQMPSFDKMYYIPFQVMTAIQLDDKILGNPDLDPESTIQYELGLQQEIVPGLAVDVTAYYKDIKNLLGLEYVTTVDNVRYKRYINRDYGNSKGITVGLRKFGSEFISGNLNYTYSTANGSSSDPDAIAVIEASTQIGGESSEFLDRQIVALDWDQTHTVNFILNFQNPNDWIASFISYYWTGQPYTPKFVERYGLLEKEYKNAASKPAQWNVDFKFSKYFSFNNGMELMLFLKIDNLFDHLNQKKVYKTSGTADYEVRLPETEALEIERLRQANLFTLAEIDLNSNWYTSPRKIQFGFEVRF